MKDSKSNPKSNLGEYDKLKLFQNMINEAIIYGFDVLLETSFDFSPVDIVLDCAIDIMLLLRRMFELGAASQLPNIGIGFSDWEQDVLGNPKQFRITSPSKYYWDPNADEFFTQLAQTFVEIKNQKPIRKCFHDFAELTGLIKPQVKVRGYSRKAKARYQYWRRRQRRNRLREKN